MVRLLDSYRMAPPGLTQVGRRRKGKSMSFSVKAGLLAQAMREGRAQLCQWSEAGTQWELEAVPREGFSAPSDQPLHLSAQVPTPNLKCQQDSSPGFAQPAFWAWRIKKGDAICCKQRQSINVSVAPIFTRYTLQGQVLWEAASLVAKDMVPGTWVSGFKSWLCHLLDRWI